MCAHDLDEPGKRLTAAANKRILFRGEGSGAAGAFSQLPLSAGALSPGAQSSGQRIFLLSPANAAGIRARMLLSEKSRFELAHRLNDAGAPLGELFSFMSALYFRGKLTYAATFANPPAGLPGILVITPSRGLLGPETITTLADLREMASASVKHTNPAYREPLERDARQVLKHLGTEGRAILLGSVATLKYVEPLLAIFGEQLLFPCDFAGRGNMSRGALLLRRSRDHNELLYMPVPHPAKSKPKPGPRMSQRHATSRQRQA